MWNCVLLTAAAGLLSGCGGGGQHMARQDAAPLIKLADNISREGACAQARDIKSLSDRTNALINARRVPAALQELLSSGVNALVVQTPPCLPAVKPDSRHGKKKHRRDEHAQGDEGGD